MPYKINPQIFKKQIEQIQSSKQFLFQLFYRQVVRGTLVKIKIILRIYNPEWGRRQRESSNSYHFGVLAYGSDGRMLILDFGI
jgi:hypothetical protein